MKGDQRSSPRLFPDAELGEDDVKEVFGIDLSGDFAEGVEGFAQVDGCEFRAGTFLGQEVDGGGEIGAGKGKRCLVAGVDGDRVLTEVGFGEMQGWVNFRREVRPS